MAVICWVLCVLRNLSNINTPMHSWPYYNYFLYVNFIDNTNQGNLTVNSINATTLHFSHSLHVQIEYSCREDGPGSQPFNVSRDGYTLRRLQPDTEYTFNCVAYHNGFDYCLEVNREAKTCENNA